MNAVKSQLPKASKIQCKTLVIKPDGIEMEFRNDTETEYVENYTADKRDKVIGEVPGAGSKIVSKA
jgi:hypothetical protein